MRLKTLMPFVSLVAIAPVIFFGCSERKKEKSIALSEEQLDVSDVTSEDLSKQNSTSDVSGLIPEALSTPSPATDSEYKESEIVVEEISIPDCHALVLIKDENSLLTQGELSLATGLLAMEVEIPGEQQQLEKRIAPLIFDRPFNTNTIGAVKQEIQEYYGEHNYPLVMVYVPKQNISDGVLQVVVAQATLDEMNVAGNVRTKEKWLRDYFEIKPGETINEKVLRRDVEFMNRNPFRHVNAILSPGKSENSTDITLLVDERRSFRAYAGADNTGIPTTGRQRWYAGFNWCNAFWLDDILSFQYTASYNLNKFQAYTAQYQVFLPWRHVISVYGGYSTLHAKLAYPSSASHGESSQGSFRYTIPFTPANTFTHEVSLGFDYRRTNNTIEFSDLFLRFGKTVNLTQVVGEYRCEKTAKICTVDFTTQIYWSPCQWLPEQTIADYSSLRPGAKPTYAYTRVALNTLFYLPGGFYWNILLRGQASTQNLLPSEQYGIGGYDTVRGYDERQLNMDDAALASIEIRSPYMKIFSRNKKFQDAFQALFFIDSGYGKNYKPIPGEHSPQYLLSVGPGLRYTLDPYIAARVDWGVKLHTNKDFTGGSSMVQFSVTASY